MTQSAQKVFVHWTKVIIWICFPGCVVAGQGVVPKPPDQTEERHHQGFRQALLLYVWVFSHLQHPAPPGAGPPPVCTSTQPSLRASLSPSKRLPAEQPGRRLLHLSWDQQQHSSQLPTRGDFWAVAAVAGRHTILTAAGCPTTTLPLLHHAAAGGRSSWTDIHLRMWFFSFWAVHAAGQEGGRSGREEDSFLSNVPLLEDTNGLTFVRAFLLSLILCCLFEVCAAAVRRKKSPRIMRNKKKEKKRRDQVACGTILCHSTVWHADTKWWKGHNVMDTISREKKEEKKQTCEFLQKCCVCILREPDRQMFLSPLSLRWF